VDQDIYEVQKVRS